ncbi:3-hydroxyacyl-ACP dehydratase FabZ family protein [Leeuwenhoekiella sp. A16]|uniref:3-hydroxyacyl-ACP dehydratase FabZ family protein n=1 Tax=unclassified Leeuwenhoekiella TaxID=2615029 RepID=UPI003A80FC0C
MEKEEIIKRLPYSEPFLFVDEITQVSQQGIAGNYKFREDAYFYQGHFVDHPVTPGVILTECMAQIGLVSLGIYLLASKIGNLEQKSGVALTSTDMQFYIPVYPGETVFVNSTLEYFRFNKLKCSVKLHNENQKLVCSGIISGMLIPDHER